MSSATSPLDSPRYSRRDRMRDPSQTVLTATDNTERIVTSQDEKIRAVLPSCATNPDVGHPKGSKIPTTPEWILIARNRMLELGWGEERLAEEIGHGCTQGAVGHVLRERTRASVWVEPMSKALRIPMPWAKITSVTAARAYEVIQRIEELDPDALIDYIAGLERLLERFRGLER